MIAVDTNVLVRLLTADDPAQTSRAAALFEQESILIPKTVLLETEWVLRSRYGLTKPEILGVFSSLLDTDDLCFENEAAVEEALYLWKDNTADFADCLIGAQNRRLGCTATVTFDAKAAKLPVFVTA